MELRGDLLIEKAGNLDELLDAMIPLFEVREYLKKQKLTLEMVQDIIGGAPVSLTEKIKWLRIYTPRVADIMQKALDALELQPGEWLWMERCRFNEKSDWDGIDTQEIGRFTTYEEALERIRADKVTERDTSFWTVLQKRISYEDEEYEIAYTWYLVEDEVVFFSENDEDRPPQWYEGSYNLHLWLPFKPGDIVTYDSEPFAPQKNAVILEKRKAAPRRLCRCYVPK